MRFRGEVLSLQELLAQSDDSNTSAPVNYAVGVLHTAADNAAEAARLVAASGDLYDGWRFGVLQTLDDYTSTVRRGGTSLGSEVFTAEPVLTGIGELDAAFAALADHLAERDGWIAPLWAFDPARQVTAWYPGVPEIFKQEATRTSPAAFRDRGIFITSRSLARA